MYYDVMTTSCSFLLTYLRFAYLYIGNKIFYTFLLRPFMEARAETENVCIWFNMEENIFSKSPPYKPLNIQFESHVVY